MSNNKFILEIHPYDGEQYNVGLANKLRAIISSIKYCEDNNFKLNVQWDMFYKLFPHVMNNELFTNEYGNLKVYPMFYPIGEENNKYGGFPGNCSVNYYSNEFPFQRIFKSLIPTQSLKNSIQVYLNEYNFKNCFGVHLRLEDFVEFSIKNNFYLPSIEDYFKQIDKFLDNHVCFYFTSDNKESYSKMKNRYASKVIFIENKNLNRRDSNSFYDAYMDLVLLSETKFILGNQYSTFSYHASRINSIPLIFCENNI
jgi:hypothetical protein